MDGLFASWTATCASLSYLPSVLFADGSSCRVGNSEHRPTTSAWTLPGDRQRGLVGQYGIRTPACVLFDEGAVTFVRLEYDHEAAATTSNGPDLPDFLADHLAAGRWAPSHRSMGPEKRLPSLFDASSSSWACSSRAPAQVSKGSRSPRAADRR